MRGCSVADLFIILGDGVEAAVVTLYKMFIFFNPPRGGIYCKSTKHSCEGFIFFFLSEFKAPRE